MRILFFFFILFLSNIGLAQQGFVTPACYNSSGNDFGPRIIDGKVFIVSDSKDSSGFYRKDIEAKRNFTDIFEIKGCEKVEASLLKADISEVVSINSEWYDGPVSYSKKDSLFFFSNTNEGLVHGKMGIYWCKKNTNGAYLTPVAFEFNSTEYSCMHPFYEDATNYLYFVSDKDSDSTGFDLYRVLLQNGKMGEVESLKNLNSSGNELFPFVYDEILYFTSNRQNGLGGMDIYSSKDLQIITLLDEPINSKFDDLSIIFTDVNKGYIASNRGNTQKNGDDIYQFYLPKLKQQKLIQPVKNQELLSELDRLYIKLVNDNDPNAILIEKARQRIIEEEMQLQELANEFANSSLRMMNYIDTTSTISFDEKVKLYEQVIADSYIPEENTSNSSANNSLNSSSNTSSNSSANTSNSSSNNSSNTTSNSASNNTSSNQDRNSDTSEDANSYAKLLELQNASAKNQSNSEIAFSKSIENISNTTISDSIVASFIAEKQKILGSTNKLNLEKVFVQDKVIPFVSEDRNIDLKLLAEHLELTALEVNKLMAYDYPITFYFDFDKSIIKKEDEEKLNYLLELVQTLNGSVRIEGHTDDKGTEAYNLNLSSKRSKKVCQYLLKFGIDKDAISIENFGETKPNADNSTIEGRSLNRRVVVVLLPKANSSEIKEVK